MATTFILRLCTRLITALSWCAPSWRRNDWRDEWLGELHFRASRLMAHGQLTPAAELRLLLRSAGAIPHVIYLWKHEWGVDMLAQDVRYGLRMLVRRKSFSAVAIVTLALAIGATTAIFTAVHAVLLAPLPYPAADRLVRIYGLNTREGQRKPSNLSVPDVADFGRRARLFEEIGAHNYGGYYTLTGVGAAERVPRLLVSSGYFRVLQAQPAIGRLFRADEDRPSPPDIAVLSYGFWQRRFGSDPAIVGRVINLSGVPVTVVGVLAPSFVHPDPPIEAAPDVFTLLDPDERVSTRSGRYVRAIGRLKPATPVKQGAAELEAIAAALASQYPASNTGRGIAMKPLDEAVAGDARTPLLLLQAATLATLLIACANLANLLLGTAAGRAGELAIRAALGAGRSRLIRQLLTESLLLALLGGALGIVLALAGTAYLGTAVPRMLLPGGRLTVNLQVLGFALFLSIAAGVAFGLIPSLHLARNGIGALRASTRHTDGRGRMRFALIALEVALSIALVIGASLLIRSFHRLTDVDPGFRAPQVLSFQVAVTLAQYPEGTQHGFYARLYEKLRELPGVTSVAATNILPLTDNYSCDGVQIVGRIVSKEKESCAEARSVSPDYFTAMGIPLVRGRFFTARDDAGGPRIVIVNEAFAREFFTGEDPVGKRIIYTSRGQGDAREIVGIVGNVRHFGLGRQPVPEFYTPQPQPPSYHGMTVILNSSAPPSALVPAIRDQVRALAPDAPVYNVRTMPELVNASVADARFRTTLLGLFAALALALAVIGTYGVISLLVAQRGQEMGIRLALGATSRDIVSLVVGRGMAPVAAGTIAGLALAYGVARAIEGLLFAVNPADPAVFAICTGLIMAAGLLASWIPARRACRVDPVVALRTQ